MQKKKLGVYIHIPFCVRKCLYCDFLSGEGSAAKKEQYVEKLIEEMTVFFERHGEKYEADTVFIGGGTPTCLTPHQIERIGKSLRPFLQCSDGITGQQKAAEFTIEANPGTLTTQHLRAFQRIGINRVSLGLQSAQNRELQALGRIHTYEEFLESYYALRKYGFSNISVDLMSAIPKQTKQSYLDTLQKIIALKPEHISSYSLIVEEGTVFYEMQKEKRLKLPTEELERKLYYMTVEQLEPAGYERYEISNYAKDGYESRHNMKYWSMEEYIGFGLGAASYFGGKRFQNTADWDTYCEKEQDNKYNRETVHTVTVKEQMEEFMFLGLRKMKGVSKTEFFMKFHTEYETIYGKKTRELIKRGLLCETEENVSLSTVGIDVSNQVMAEFLLDTEIL